MHCLWFRSLLKTRPRCDGQKPSPPPQSCAKSSHDLNMNNRRRYVNLLSKYREKSMKWLARENGWDEMAASLIFDFISLCKWCPAPPPPHVRDEENCFPHNQFVMHLVTQVNDQAISALFSMPPCVVYVTCFKQAAIFELFLTLLVMTLASCFRPHDNKWTLWWPIEFFIQIIF